MEALTYLLHTEGMHQRWFDKLPQSVTNPETYLRVLLVTIPRAKGVLKFNECFWVMAPLVPGKVLLTREWFHASFTLKWLLSNM
jgi:hypothetical protein